QDVLAGEVVVAGPPESVPCSLDVGEERLAARPGEHADPAGLDGPLRRVEADGKGRGQQLAVRLWLAGPDAGRGGDGPGLRAAVALGEGERESGVGLRVAVVVDVDPVDRLGMELPGGDDRRRQLDGRPGRRVDIDDQYRLARVLRRSERVEVGEFQA